MEMTTRKILLILCILIAPVAGENSPQSGGGQSAPYLDGDADPTSERSIFSSQKIDDICFFPNSPKSSPDSTKIAYLLGNDVGYLYYIIAGPEGKTTETAYESIRPDSFVFSPDGKHHGYKAYKGGNWVAVIDGSEGKEYDEIWWIFFSQDGERYAYRAKKDGQEIVVVDGIEEGPYKGSSDPIISSAGQHVLYTMAEESLGPYRDNVVVNGVVQELKGVDPVVSPEGSRWGYYIGSVYRGRTGYIVLDGEAIALEKEKTNRIDQMVFSPNGSRFAYNLVPDGGAYGDHVVVVDGIPGRRYSEPGVGNIVFSPDESTVAYWAKADDGGFMMVVDGEEGKVYDVLKIGDPVISQDGSHVAYVVDSNDGAFVVLDGEEGKKYQSIWGLTFSPDGRLAYVASDAREEGFVHLVVVDGKEDQTYQSQLYGQGIKSGPCFSPDGGHIAYIAKDGDGDEFVVVDSKGYINPWTSLEQNLVWDSEEEFHYIGQNNCEGQTPGVYLVTVTIPLR
jgi:hypothetical protein